MATAEWLAENPQVIGYIPKRIHELLLGFKTKHDLKSCSQALIAVLGEYFGQEPKSRRDESGNREPEVVKALEQRVEALEKRLSQIVEVNTALAEPSSSSIPQQIPTSISELGLQQVEVSAPESTSASPALETSNTTQPQTPENINIPQIERSESSMTLTKKEVEQVEKPKESCLLLPAAKETDSVEVSAIELNSVPQEKILIAYENLIDKLDLVNPVTVHCDAELKRRIVLMNQLIQQPLPNKILYSQIEDDHELRALREIIEIYRQGNLQEALSAFRRLIDSDDEAFHTFRTT